MARRLLCLVASIAVALGAGGWAAAPAGAAVAGWQQGASLVPTDPDDFGRESTCRSITELRRTGASHVTLVVPHYQSSVSSSDIAAGWDTPTDDSLRRAISCARAQGLQVMLKFHLELYSGEWRAKVRAADRDAWYRGWGSLLVRYARLAAATGVGQLCLGAELHGMSSPVAHPDNTARWRGMIRAVRAVYGGALTYSSQRDSEYDELHTLGFWPQLDAIGISGYYRLDVAAPVTVWKLTQRWAEIERASIRPVQARYGKPVLFTEVGYRSVERARLDPWNWQRAGAPDEAEQARLYGALHTFWNRIGYVRGVHLWDWSTDPSAGGPGDTGYSPQGKEAQRVLARWWGGTVPTSAPAGQGPDATGRPGMARAGRGTVTPAMAARPAREGRR